jgi:hypothetical protein
MITEQRKKYLHNYRKKNRKVLSDYLRNYLHRTKKNYYKYKGSKLNGDYCGTSGIGREYEKLAVNILGGKVIDIHKNSSFSGKYDLIWNNKTVEVKMRNKTKKGRYGFTFKKGQIADFYLLFCVELGKINKVLLIPKVKMPNLYSLSISDNSKYDKYKILVNTEQCQLNNN